MESVRILAPRELFKVKQCLEMFRKHFHIDFIEDFLADGNRKGKENIQGILCASGKQQKHLTDEDFILSFPNLKIIATPSTGISHLDVSMLQRHGVKVSNVPGDVIANPTAEFGFGLMLALARNMHLGMGAYLDEDFDWLTHWFTHSGSLLLGSTLGIVGMGNIGYKIAERAAAFKMNILYYNRNQRSNEDESRVHATYCRSLDDLLRMSDHVMLVVPLSDETKAMIGTRELKLMKPTASLINISRGAVVDQDALVEALNQKSIRGAALDVTSPEPLPRDHPLMKMSNVIVTPHYAGGTVQNIYEGFKICFDNIKAAIEEKPVPNEVTPIGT